MTQSDATILGQSGPGSNDNEGVLHIPPICRAGALPSDGLMSYIQDTHRVVGILPPPCRDAFGVFYCLSCDWTVQLSLDVTKCPHRADRCKFLQVS